MQRATSYNMYINQQDAQNSVIRLYFPLDALHISESVSPSSGATFYKLYIAFNICRYMPIRLAYTGIYQMRCTACNVAPDDGLTQSETCRACNGK